MKNNNRFCKALSVMLAMVTMISAMAIPVGATEYETYISRGIKNVSYCKTTFTWTVNSRISITDSSAYQITSGINIDKGGTYRRYANGLEHEWAAVTESILGLSIKGIVFGITVSYEDIVELYNSGGASVEWD
ncbi:MAG: hypothetical protein IJO29_08455 [Oscillospiraceae bacterium]|nr:hypothetical protein [Oscillospiraceae bacterium]